MRIDRSVKSVCRLVYLMNLVKLEHASAEEGRTVIEIKLTNLHKKNFEAVCERYRRSVYGYYGKVRRLDAGSFEFTCRENRLPESYMSWTGNTASLRMIVQKDIDPDVIVL